jgi:hypothetical protein
VISRAEKLIVAQDQDVVREFRNLTKMICWACDMGSTPEVKRCDKERPQARICGHCLHGSVVREARLKNLYEKLSICKYLEFETLCITVYVVYIGSYCSTCI